MTNGADRSDDRAEQWSALVDGELDAAAVASLCAQWRDDPQCRRRWHDYQLIGDVLRSDDLAASGAHDSALLAALRGRLAAEPTVLAPLAAEPAATPLPVLKRPSRWIAAGAMAAGFAVVIGGMLALAGLPDLRRAPETTLADAGVARLAADAAAPAAEQQQPMPASGQLIRDARLDRYFAAHQQWSGGAMLGGHAAYLRHTTNNDSAPR